MQDRVSAAIVWRDLVPMRRIDGAIECAHPLPWLAASLASAASAYWPLAMPCSFMFFLTALRLNHEAIHGNLGFGARGHRWVLHVLSALMLGSNSAVAFNHLRHHRFLGTNGDLEGGAGRMRLGEVLAYGPRFPLDMHRAAWRLGGARLRRRMRIDLALNVALLVLAVAVPVLRYHLAAMLVAQCLTAFFAVWITHHDCPDHVARSQRQPLLNWLSYNMFLHDEHHRFPAVPVRRLGILQRRLHALAPGAAAPDVLSLARPRVREPVA